MSHLRLEMSLALLLLLGWAMGVSAATFGNDRPIPADSKTWGRSYNARSTDLGHGKIQSDFHIKWINYLDEDRTWQEIDPYFVETETEFATAIGDVRAAALPVGKSGTESAGSSPAKVSATAELRGSQGAISRSL